MVNLIIVRHGQTNSNKNELIMGQNSTSLNDLGVNQAKKLAIELKRHYNFKNIFSSDLKRAVQTFHEIKMEFPNIKPIFLEGLRERNIGKEFEGKHYSEFDKMVTSDSGDYLIDKSSINGESASVFYNRVKKTLSSILGEISNLDKNDNILIVSHGGTIRQLLAYLFIERSIYTPNNSYTHFPIDVRNCSITAIAYNESNRNKFILQYVNYFQFLSD